MEKLQKKENFKTLEEAVECYDELYAAYESCCSSVEYQRTVNDYASKRVEKLDAKLSAISSILNL